MRKAAVAAARRLGKRLPIRPLRVARLRLKARRILLDWRGPLASGLGGRSWDAIRQAAAGDAAARRVLVATTVGGNLATLQFDAMLAVALTLRGAKVEFLLCDAALPACMMAQHDWYPDPRRFLAHGSHEDICKACHPVGAAHLAALGLTIHRLSDLVDGTGRAAVAAATAGVGSAAARSWTFEGLPVGEHALAGALRYHARGDLDGVPHGEEIFRAYLRAGCLAAKAAARLASNFPAEVVVAHHGIYVPQGIWVAAARRHGQRVVTWNPGYRRNCFVLSEDDTYHRTMITEDPALWEGGVLGPEEEARLTRYLDDRRSGADDWISFGSGEEGSFADCLAELGLDPDKPTIVLLTSVNWDAQLHYESNAFANQLAWLDRSLDLFKARPDVNLAVRVHPAELTGNIRSRQPLAEHIAARHPDLPAHIAVVGPENAMNTYALADGADSVLIYSTKTGIELSARGTPVVVAGEAWIRGKGFSIDAASPTDYAAIVARLPLKARLSPEEHRRARLYADHFFFRRMIALPGFEPGEGWPPYRVAVETLAPLAPGADANLDMICERIIAGGPFVAGPS